MKRLFFLLLLASLVLYCNTLQAQNSLPPVEERTLPSFMYENDDFEYLGLKYKLPDGFIHSYREVYIHNMFWNIGGDGLVKSKDKELFILFYFTYHNRKDSADLSIFQSPERQMLLSPNTMHRGTINGDIINITYYKKPVPNIESHLRYYPLNKAKEYYNADSAFIYDINVKDHPYRYILAEEEPELMSFEKHKNCTAFMLHKKDRGFLVMYMFHSDKAAAHLDDYIEKLRGIFWFRED